MVITSKIQETSLCSLIRAALKPWNTENLNIEDELVLTLPPQTHTCEARPNSLS